MTPTLENLSTMRSQIESIAQLFGVSHVRVFGSVARDEAREGSDVDLLVRVEPERSLLDVIGFEDAVCDLLGTKVDVVEEGGLNPVIKAAVLREARPL